MAITSITDTCLSEEETEEHPEGGDRGGYNIVSHTIAISRDGTTLEYEMENGDCYESFAKPTPNCSNREEAIGYLESTVAHLRIQLNAAELLLAYAKKTTKFTTNVEAEQEDFEDD